jgi:hypothetical protein
MTPLQDVAPGPARNSKQSVLESNNPNEKVTLSSVKGVNEKLPVVVIKLGSAKEKLYGCPVLASVAVKEYTKGSACRSADPATRSATAIVMRRIMVLLSPAVGETGFSWLQTVAHRQIEKRLI